MKKVFKRYNYPCPCCGYLTQEILPSDDICPICHWQNDPVQFVRQDYSGGENKITLREARINFLKFGAVSRECLEVFEGSVKPKAEQIPKVRWFWLLWMTYSPRSYILFRELQLRLTGRWGKPYG